jgi:hypothetical protein
MTRNPLARRADRVDGALRVAAWLIGALVLVVIVLGAQAWYTRARAQAAAVSAGQAVTQAIVQADVPVAGGGTAGLARRGTTRGAPVPAMWTAPDGTSRTGSISAPPGTSAGTPVELRIDRATGMPAAPPADPAVLLTDVIAVATLAAMAWLVIVQRCCALTGRLRMRGRMRWWEAQWARLDRGWPQRQD